MAVTVNNGTQTPVVGAETTIATIAGGPYDFISVYIQGGSGGAGGAIGVNVYATVAGIPTLVGAAQVMGSASAIGSLVEFADLKTGATGTTSVSQQAGSSFLLNAGGSNYTVKIIDLSTTPVPPGGTPRQSCLVTLAGVQASDTAAPTANQSAFAPLAPGATGTLATFPGFQEQMDVGVAQVAGMNVTITIAASNGPGSVTANVKQQSISTPTAIPGFNGSVFRNVQLPVATTYTVSITNNASTNVTTDLSGISYEGVGAGGGGGGAIPLNGDVIGPSNANTVIKWDNVPLLLGAAPGFTTPADAAVPIYDIGLNEWRTFALSGGATMTNAGVVTIAAGSITLAGNANGPANANRIEAFTIESTDADVVVGQFTAINATGGEFYVGMNGLTADRTVNIPAMDAGSKVFIKDEDGSLAAHNIILLPAAGKTIDGATPYTMTAVQNGVKGSITILMNGNAPSEWSII